MAFTFFDALRGLTKDTVQIEIKITPLCGEVRTGNIEVKYIRKGIYKIVKEDVTSRPEIQRLGDAEDFELAISSWSSEVENLDEHSYAGSDHLRWKDVEIKMQEAQVSAPSMKRLREALSQITFCASNIYEE